MENNNPYKRFSSIFLMLVVCLVVVFSQSVNAFDWNDETSAYYKLDETSGTIAVDQENNYNGTASNARVFTTGATGIINTAADFTGGDDELRISSSLTGIKTLSFWHKPLAGQTWLDITLSKRASPTNRIYLSYQTSNSFTFRTPAGVSPSFATNLWAYDDWNHAVIIFTGSRLLFYSNGTLAVNISNTESWDDVNSDWVFGEEDGAGYYSENYIDEIGMWNRTLITSEVLELFNSGSALGHGVFGEQVNITLEAPEDEALISDIGTNFTVNGNVTTSFNTTNITYYVWNSTNEIHNQTTISLSPSHTFDETLFIDAFTVGNYTWNAKVCYENSTYSNCEFAESNFTFDVSSISVLEEEFSPSVLGGDSATFQANLSVIAFERLTNVLLVYNDTQYTTTFTEYETDKWSVSTSLNVPDVTSSEVVEFYWSVSLESGVVQNTTSNNQTILSVSIDDCSTFTNQIFNFTSVDEKTQVQIDGAAGNTSIKIDMSFSYLDGSGEVATFSNHYDEVNPARVCMNNSIGNSSLRMDAVLEYTASGKFVEFYNIQNFTFEDSTKSQNITLYNLAEDEGQEFKITYKGQDFIPVSDLIIQIQRKYVSEGETKTIEIPMSGTNGFTIAHLVPNDVVYNLFFIKDGVILDAFTDVIANCQNPAITECEINLNALITGTDLFNIIDESDFFSTLTYDKDNRIVSSTFGITSGVSSLVKLNVTLIDNFGNNTACSDSLNGAGGTLSCTVPESFGNGTVYAYITYDDEVRREGYVSLRQNPKDQYGGVLILSSVILLMFIFGIGVNDNPMITGIFLILGVLLLIGLNMVYSTSIIGAGATALWFIVAVLIVIIKGGSKR